MAGDSDTVMNKKMGRKTIRDTCKSVYASLAINIPYHLSASHSSPADNVYSVICRSDMVTAHGAALKLKSCFLHRQRAHEDICLKDGTEDMNWCFNWTSASRFSVEFDLVCVGGLKRDPSTREPLEAEVPLSKTTLNQVPVLLLNKTSGAGLQHAGVGPQQLLCVSHTLFTYKWEIINSFKLIKHRFLSEMHHGNTK